MATLVSLIMPLECNVSQNQNLSMKRLFRRGERVKSKLDGKVMEVLKYIRTNLVEVKWFDLEKKEVRVHHIKEDNLRKAS